MANAYRGEVALRIGGRERVLRLTLGALCELEETCEGGSVVALVERFETGRVLARDLLALIAAGLRGAGEAITLEEVARLEIEGGPVAAARAAAELLRVTFAMPEG